MPKIDPFDLDPADIQEEFFNFQERVFEQLFSEMFDLHSDLLHMMFDIKHPKNFDAIEEIEILEYLKTNGLKNQTLDEKANPDFYYTVYECFQTFDWFFMNAETMGYEDQLIQLLSAKRQYTSLEYLSPTGKPQYQPKNTQAQSKGAKIANAKKYQFTRLEAHKQWQEHKNLFPDWTEIKDNHLKYRKLFDNHLKDFISKLNKSNKDKHLINYRFIGDLILDWIEKIEKSVTQKRGSKISPLIEKIDEYKLLKQEVEEYWTEYKNSLDDWSEIVLKNNSYEKQLNKYIKNFEENFFDSLTAKKLNQRNKNTKILDEKYTDKLAIGWVKEFENIPDDKKEKVTRTKSLNKIFKITFSNKDQLYR